MSRSRGTGEVQWRGNLRSWSCRLRLRKCAFFGRAELLIENTDTSLVDVEYVPPPGSEKRNQFHAILSNSCKVGVFDSAMNRARLSLFNQCLPISLNPKFSINGLIAVGSRGFGRAGVNPAAVQDSLTYRMWGSRLQGLSMPLQIGSEET